MKYYDLDKEEKQILEDFEKGKYVSIKDFPKAKKAFQEAAVYTLAKAKNINIRLSQKDLLKLKARAIEDGLPYQTLVSSILHRFINNVATV